MIKSIIIEDEKPAARHLQKMVQDNHVEVIALLHSVEESIRWLLDNPNPDLIFLDIQLGDGLSFEIFEKVQPISAIIFTTAYDQFALKAFKFNSIDYLLKPINKIDLQNAIAKYENQKTPLNIDLYQIQALLQTNFESKYRERFLVKIGSNMRTFTVQDIACFYSRDKTTYLFSEGREFPIDDTLLDLANDLHPKTFFPISRSAIVNLAFIDNIFSYSGSRYKVQIKHVTEELIVSRERVQEFKQWLSS